MIETNKIYGENCLETMARMPDGFVDLTVTSPPYNFNRRIHSGKWTVRHVNEKTKYAKSYHDALTVEEYYLWQFNVISELLRVTRTYVFYNIQVLTGNKPAVFRLFGAFAEQIKEVMIWDKVNAEPAIAPQVLNSQFEFVIVFAKQNAIARQFEVCNFGRGTMSNVLRISKNSKNNNAEYHSATFPTALPGVLIKQFSNENDLVYDPFMGSGTTAKAAHQLNRRWVGSELNPDYVAIAERRLEPYLAQASLFTIGD